MDLTTFVGAYASTGHITDLEKKLKTHKKHLKKLSRRGGVKNHANDPEFMKNVLTVDQANVLKKHIYYLKDLRRSLKKVDRNMNISINRALQRRSRRSRSPGWRSRRYKKLGYFGTPNARPRPKSGRRSIKKISRKSIKRRNLK